MGSVELLASGAEMNPSINCCSLTLLSSPRSRESPNLHLNCKESSDQVGSS